jgi:hypothetical protein
MFLLAQSSSSRDRSGADYQSMVDRTDLTLNQERKVIILATTRSGEESHPRRSLGLLMDRQRMNGWSFVFPIRVLTRSGMDFVSGNHTGAGLVDCDRRPRSAGKV